MCKVYVVRERIGMHDDFWTLDDFCTLKVRKVFKNKDDAVSYVKKFNNGKDLCADDDINAEFDNNFECFWEEFDLL